MFIVKNYEFSETGDFADILNEEIYNFNSLEESKEFIRSKWSNNKNYDLTFLDDEFVYRIESETEVKIYEYTYVYKLVIMEQKS
jgi:hypothetical protein